MSLFSKIIFWLGLIFLVVSLWNANYLHLPEIINVKSLIYSLLLIPIFTVVGCIPWYQNLKTNDVELSLSMAIKSMGLFVFAKYVPGKIWVILGRATWISDQYSELKSKTSLISLQTQLLGLWFGLLTGVIGLISIAPTSFWVIPALVILILMGVMLFVPSVSQSIKKTIQSLLKKHIEIPSLNIMQALYLAPSFIGYWLLIGISLMFLGNSIIPGGVNYPTVLCFNLAAVIGVFAVIAPGGLGVREGVLIGCLMLGGLSLTNATSLAITSRLWFLASEISLFFIGIIIPPKSK